LRLQVFDGRWSGESHMRSCNLRCVAGSWFTLSRVSLCAWTLFSVLQRVSSSKTARAYLGGSIRTQFRHMDDCGEVRGHGASACTNSSNNPNYPPRVPASDVSWSTQSKHQFTEHRPISKRRDPIVTLMSPNKCFEFAPLRGAAPSYRPATRARRVRCSLK
jgi:hypothetical protein